MKLKSNLSISSADLRYLKLDGTNNLTGSSSWLTQSAGDARYIVSGTGFNYSVSSTISMTVAGLTPVQISGYDIVKVQGDGGAVTVTGTPNIAAATSNGKLLILLGMDDTNTVTFQDGSTLDGSGLTLSYGQNMTLGKGDTLHLIYETALDNWIEVSRSNNVFTKSITSFVVLEDGSLLITESGNNIILE